MENKGLLKLPETWHIKLTEENAETIKSYFKGFRQYDVGFAFGMVDGEIESRIAGFAYKMGQEITFADFKRLVLGEKNHEDYGVLGCEELSVYFEYNNVEDLEGRIKENIYFLLSRWDYEDFENSKRQSLPLTEYLKLIDEKPESMEKKYEYKLIDEKYIEPILKLTDRKIDFTFPLREEIVPNTITILRDLNVLDLFFEKIELKELPIIGGSKPIISEDGDLIEIAGFQIDMYIIDHFKSFTLGNGIHVSESDIKQIREYLRK